VQTDPSNETVEVWNELSGSLLVWALFAGGTIPLIYLLIGRALRPLGRLTTAMERVGGGDYAIRVDDRLTPEFARLRDSFNRMAERLATADFDNRRLNEQLARLQEEERNELARDLHDEIGPVLFAINVDLLNMKRLLGDAQDGELAAQARSIEDAVRHLQHQMRGMLGRLRPLLPAELSLPQAIDGLLEFWRRQCPHVALEADISTRCHELGDPLYTTVYRILQESLSNSIRHGQPAAVIVAIACDDAAEKIVIEVADDGVGSRGEPELGYGLTGMKERARALGGSLTFANRPGGGFAVRAELPLRRDILPVEGAG
jgi:two-component system sensor histidine kinase UhpB